MRTSANVKIILGIFLVLICLTGFGNDVKSETKQIHTWEPFEISFKSKTTIPNPFVSMKPAKEGDMVSVIFTGTGGEASGKTITIIGFWDGGNTWKARFTASYAGTWAYKSFSKDPGLHGKKGTITSINWTKEETGSNPARHGFVRVHKTGTHPGRYFEYTDGTPFLWIGDTWWNWSQSKTSVARFSKVVDDRAKKGFNIGQLYISSWGSTIVKADTTLDILRFQKLDSMILYANSKGITVFLSPWWGGKALNKSKGENNIRKLERYIVHRFAAYNVIWVLASEYNMWNYGGLGLQFWKDLGTMVKNEDPYERIVSVHPTPGGWDAGDEAPQWSTAEVLHYEPWLDYNQSQTGHSKSANELIPDVVMDSYKRTPVKPIVVTEPWYEFDTTQPNHYRQPSPEDIRFGAWSAILNGAAGHTYGGGHIWVAHTPETEISKKSYWPTDRSFESNTLDYPGAVSMGVLANFFRSIDWWNLEPHPELILDHPSKYCAAIPGKEYLAYLRYGGYVAIDMTNTSDKDSFEYYWLNPSDGTKEKTVTVKGGKKLGLYIPNPSESNKAKDWVFYMKKI